MIERDKIVEKEEKAEDKKGKERGEKKKTRKWEGQIWSKKV